LKVEQAKNLIHRCGSHALVEVDGGVNLTIGSELVKSGADVLVSGSFIFGSTNPTQIINEFKALK